MQTIDDATRERIRVAFTDPHLIISAAIANANAAAAAAAYWQRHDPAGLLRRLIEVAP